VQKEAEKKLKYKTLCIEIQQMQNVECMILPVIIAATRMATKCLRKNLKDIPGKYSVDSPQKTCRYTLNSTHNKEITAA
jgi:hypothetical protein